MSISTKKGDRGFTDLIGARVPKNDPRVEVLGALDELDAFLAAAAFSAAAPEIPTGAPDSTAAAEIIEAVRKELAEKIMPFTAEMARHKPGEDPAGFLRDELSRLEGWIAALEQERPAGVFIRRWTKPAAIKLNIARTVCRRAERRMAEMARAGQTPVDAPGGSPNLPVYINRLSDLLFLLAAAAELS